MLIRIAVTVTWRLSGRQTFFDAKRAPFPQRTPREVKQVGHAQILQGLERERARVQKRGKTQDRRSHVRENAKRASERGDDAGTRAAQRPAANV